MPHSTTGPVSIETLLDIMKRLRDPVRGCPWDLQQDSRSIAPYTLEEAYEVVEAIEHDGPGAVRGELGDLLFQVVFHAQLASEAGEFDFSDVVQSISEKMIRRHPHVFAGARVADATQQTVAWERHKERERGARTSLMDGVPLAMSALDRACKLQKRAAHAGFDWPDVSGALDKLGEETREFATALAGQHGRDAVIDEAGDLLFSVVNVLRHAGIDPESALRMGNRKFERRFRALEQRCRSAGIDPSAAGIDTLEAFWCELKQEEQGAGPDRAR